MAYNSIRKSSARISQDQNNDVLLMLLPPTPFSRDMQVRGVSKLHFETKQEL